MEQEKKEIKQVYVLFQKYQFIVKIKKLKKLESQRYFGGLNIVKLVSEEEKCIPCKCSFLMSESTFASQEYR